jgi:hypothetical protein
MTGTRKMNIGKARRSPMKPPEQVAREHFDKWNDVTGFVVKGTSYYYEILSVMEDALTAARREAIEECAMVAETYLHEQGLTKNGKWTADKIRILAKPGGDPKGESLRPPRVKGPARRTSKGERER